MNRDINQNQSDLFEIEQVDVEMDICWFYQAQLNLVNTHVIN